MLKLLTKFKTQSLNEVKPYESNGSLVSFCGEIQSDDDAIHDQSWPQDICGSQPEKMNGGMINRTTFPTTCFISQYPSDLVKTIQLPAEVPLSKTAQLVYENEVNGIKRSSQKRQTGLSAEKRKWSDVKSSRSSKQQGYGGSDSSSSDEEVKELFSKQQRSDRSSIENPGNNRQIKSDRSGKVRPCESHTRKRHRLTFADDRIYRPSLDFEKMQQSCSGHPHSLLPDPSVVSFKPIQTIQTLKLTPVEEPRALAF